MIYAIIWILDSTTDDADDDSDDAVGQLAIDDRWYMCFILEFTRTRLSSTPHACKGEFKYEGRL